MSNFSKNQKIRIGDGGTDDYKNLRRETSLIMIQEKKKVRFNFIDAIIIIVILAVIGAAVLLITGDMKQSRSTSDGKIEFEVRITQVDEKNLSLIKVGDTVKDSSTGKVIGTIVNVETKKSVYYGNTAISENGVLTLPQTEYADQYDVYILISAEANKDSRGIYSIGSTRIVIGSPVYFKVPSFAAVSYITEFSTRIPG